MVHEENLHIIFMESSWNSLIKLKANLTKNAQVNSITPAHTGWYWVVGGGQFLPYVKNISNSLNISRNFIQQLIDNKTFFTNTESTSWVATDNSIPKDIIQASDEEKFESTS